MDGSTDGLAETVGPAVLAFGLGAIAEAEGSGVAGFKLEDCVLVASAA